LALAAALIVVGIGMSGGATTPFNLVSFILLVASGGVILYSLWIVMMAFTFWFVKFDNNVTILQALLDAGRYPATVYPVWLRLIVTFIVPIAVATTVPCKRCAVSLAGGRCCSSWAWAWPVCWSLAPVNGRLGCGAIAVPALERDKEKAMTSKVKFMPEGYHTVTSYLLVRNVAGD
jgi:hypothetical protein